MDVIKTGVRTHFVTEIVPSSSSEGSCCEPVTVFQQWSGNVPECGCTKDSISSPANLCAPTWLCPHGCSLLCARTQMLPSAILPRNVHCSREAVAEP